MTTNLRETPVTRLRAGMTIKRGTRYLRIEKKDTSPTVANLIRVWYTGALKPVYFSRNETVLVLPWT